MISLANQVFKKIKLIKIQHGSCVNYIVSEKLALEKPMLPDMRIICLRQTNHQPRHILYSLAVKDATFCSK